MSFSKAPALVADSSTALKELASTVRSGKGEQRGDSLLRDYERFNFLILNRPFYRAFYKPDILANIRLWDAFSKTTFFCQIKLHPFWPSFQVPSHSQSTHFSEAMSRFPKQISPLRSAYPMRISIRYDHTWVWVQNTGGCESPRSP